MTLWQTFTDAEMHAWVAAIIAMRAMPELVTLFRQAGVPL